MFSSKTVKRVVSLATSVALAMLGAIVVIQINMMLYAIVFMAMLGAITSVVLVSMLIEALLDRVLGDSEPVKKNGARNGNKKKEEKEKPVLKKLTDNYGSEVGAEESK